MRKLFIIAIISFLYSCKGEDHDDPIQITNCGNIKGAVYDSISGTPIANAVIYTDYMSAEVFDSAYTNNNGEFNFNACTSWGIYYKPSQGEPDDYEVFNLWATNDTYDKVGKTTFYWKDIKAPSNTVVKNINLIPVGYVKIHIKDTIVNPIDSCFYTLFDAFHGSVVGRIYDVSLDTTFLIKELPNKDVTLQWNKCDESKTYDTTLFIPSNDTLSLDIFY